MTAFHQVDCSGAAVLHGHQTHTCTEHWSRKKLKIFFATCTTSIMAMRQLTILHIQRGVKHLQYKSIVLPTLHTTS